MDKNRIPAELLVQGLTTKADKIRTLAKADYLRAEIAKFLGKAEQRWARDPSETWWLPRG